MVKTRSDFEPSVGIFWCFRGRLLLEQCTIPQAEQYGENLGYGGSHVDCWTRLQDAGEVPADKEYEEAPRGRIVYLPRSARYLLFADRCILDDKAFLQRVMRAFHLPPRRTTASPDAHYRCYRCLGISQE